MVAAASAGAQDGSKRWAAKVGGYIELSSPALSPDGGKVYVGVTTTTGGRLVEVTADGAARVLGREFSEGIDATPAVGADGTIYVGSYDGRFHAVSPTDGARKWSVDTGTFVVSSAAIAADGTIYFGAGDGKLRAVSPTGTVKWTFAAGDWIDSSPAIGPDGAIYFGSRDRSLYAVNPDGTRRWQFATGGRVDSSPAIGSDGTIYVGSADQRLYAVAPDGTKRWELITNGEILASPVLGADGTVYVAAVDQAFYAVDAADGSVRWKRTFSANSVSSAAVRGDGAIIFADDDCKVRALNPRDGSDLWTFDTEAPGYDYIESSPLVAPDGSIYVGSSDGMLYRINGSGSPLSLASNWPSFRGGAARQGRVDTAGQGGGRLLNLSTRAAMAPGGVMIAGFVMEGSGPKAYLVRGVGPALAVFGVADFMADPRLDLFAGRTLLRVNDNWQEVTTPSFGTADVAAGVGAFPLPEGSRDAALVLTLDPGLYTAQVRGADGGGGVALVEVYDAIGGDARARLTNLSMRGRVGAGENALFVGVAVGGSTATKLLVRAVGPGLAQFDVEGVLGRPSMTVFDSRRTPLRTNTGWTTQGFRHDVAMAAARVAAFALADGSADSALVFTASPGSYTIQISGVGGATGEALAEIYVLP